VLHAFFVPAFRVKRDLVPGMYTSVWFRPTKEGTVDLFCAEYCGGISTMPDPKDPTKKLDLDPSKYSGHWAMITKTVVESPEAYADYLDKLDSGDPPEIRGKKLYAKKSCNTCHSVDGSPGTGPTWKGLFGSSHAIVGGATVKVDENYVTESILEPNAKVVAGFQSPSVMPTYKGQIRPKDIDAIIVYMKTLK
jgi:cytochrome c oxidase subunit II